MNNKILFIKINPRNINAKYKTVENSQVRVLNRSNKSVNITNKHE